MIYVDCLDYDEAARYLGYRENKPDELMLDIMKDCEKQIIDESKGNFCYRVFEITNRDYDNKKITLNGTSLVLEGQSIIEHLEGCDKVIVMAATLGSDIDRLITRAQVRSVAGGMVMDVMASVGIEKVCDIAMEEMKKTLPDVHMTWRFSPGYGDMPLGLQGDVLEAIDARKRIGLGLTKGDMLTPVKSVTAIIGLFSQPVIENNVKPACGKEDTCLKCPRHKVCNISPLKQM